MGKPYQDSATLHALELSLYPQFKRERRRRRDVGPGEDRDLLNDPMSPTLRVDKVDLDPSREVVVCPSHRSSPNDHMRHIAIVSLDPVEGEQVRVQMTRRRANPLRGRGLPSQGEIRSWGARKPVDHRTRGAR